MESKTFSESLTNVLKTKLYTEGGCYGYYVRYCFYRGIKILHNKFASLEDAEESNLYSDAVQEMNLLKETKRRFALVPHCYGVKIVKIGNSFQIGIILQHLGSITLRDFAYKNDLNVSVDNTVLLKYNQLKAVGITHTDIHGRNIMRFKKKWWIIDFSPEYLEIA